ncbi:MAG: ABC transporter substrate-binding protein [Actinomycetes bacterium]|nr:ABC transporter substrate-binding protein [Actinomycetes bacterium]
MTQPLRLGALLLAATMLLLPLTACRDSGKDTQSSSIKSAAMASGEKKITVAISSEPISLDAAQTMDYNSDRVSEDIYDTLLRFADGSMEIEPALCERYEVSDDGLVYTLHLRHGVKFHDGTDFNAAAVLFNYQRLTDKKNPYYGIGTYPFGELVASTVKTLTAQNEDTVIITLYRADASFPTALAIPQVAAIPSPTAIKKLGKDYGKNPVGTGPYKFKSWVPGNEITFVSNPDYWGGAPAVTRLVYRFVIDPAARLSQLKAGTVDMAVNISPSGVDELKASESIVVDTLQLRHTWFLIPNTSVAPFNEVRVRQAFAYAINQQNIDNYILLGSGEATDNMLPESTPLFNGDVASYDYNPDKARELLKEAGYEHGLEIDFYVPESGPGMQQPKWMGNAIVDNLQAVGVILNLKVVPFNDLLEMVVRPPKEQTLQLSALSWIGQRGTAEDFLYLLCYSKLTPPHGFNMSYWSNKRFDSLLEQAQVSTDLRERHALFREIQEIVAEELPYIAIDHASAIIAYNNRIRNFKIHPRGFLRFSAVDLELAD